MPKGVAVDDDGILAGYNDVRNDETESVFVMLTYNEENTMIRYLTHRKS